MPRLSPAVFLIGLMSVSAAGAADWSQWRGPNRDGKAVEPGLQLDWNARPPQHLWTMEGLGAGYASVSIADGLLYTTGNYSDGQAVACVDLSNQKRIWKTPLTERPPVHDYPGSRCTPTLDGDRLYVVTSDGQIACLKTADGKVVWYHNFQRDWQGRLMSHWGYSESPLVDGDQVVCTPGGPDAMMVALDKQTGEEIWRVKVPYQGELGKDGAGYSSVVISHGGGVKQYVQLTGRGLVGVRANDGKLLWQYDKVANHAANIPTSICTGDFVFASSGYEAGAALLKLSPANDGVTAEEVYLLDRKTFQNHHGGMILDGEFIYAGHKNNDGFPICLHLPTGQVRWGGDIRPDKKMTRGSAAITEVNQQLIFRYETGTLALISADPDQYQLQGLFTPEFQEGQSWAHPVVLDGKLYLREQDKLMCYQL